MPTATLGSPYGADGSFVRTTRTFRNADCSSLSGGEVGAAVVEKGSLRVYGGSLANEALFELTVDGTASYGRISLKHQIGFTPDSFPGASKAPLGAMCFSDPTYTKDNADKMNAPLHCVKRTTACPVRLGKDCGTYQRPALASSSSTEGCKAMREGGSFEETFVINFDDSFTRTIHEYTDAACGAGP